MGEFKVEAIAVLIVLLPGFLATSIKQRLVVNREQSELDKIIEALLYSFVTTSYMAGAAGLSISDGVPHKAEEEELAAVLGTLPLKPFEFHGHV